MKDTYKELRLEIDNLYQVSKKQLSGSKETVDCIKSLLLAKAWAGKALGSVGEPTPYKNEGNRKTISDIEPTDSVAQTPNLYTEIGQSLLAIAALSYVEQIDLLRQEISKTELNFNSRCNATAPNDRLEAIARTQIYIYLSEARIYLGFELQRLRDTDRTLIPLQ